MPSACAGFTLLETLIAITILTLAVAGPLFTASRSIIAARGASYKLTASYLAHESAEYVHKLRDDYYLDAIANPNPPETASTTGWANLRSAIGACSFPSWCTFDPFPQNPGDPKLVPCAGSCGPLYLTSTTGGVYTQRVIDEPTMFTRTVRSEHVSDTEERIISEVKWNFREVQYTITTTDHLTPWQSP